MASGYRGDAFGQRSLNVRVRRLGVRGGRSAWAFVFVFGFGAWALVVGVRVGLAVGNFLLHETKKVRKFFHNRRLIEQIFFPAENFISCNRCSWAALILGPWACAWGWGWAVGLVLGGGYGFIHGSGVGRAV